MGFLARLFHKDHSTESIIVIDIGADSVGGAYVHYETGALPTLIYTQRIKTENHEGEAREHAMLRTLEQLANDLLVKGAPALARATGSGRADLVLVSIDAPWQETTVRSEVFESETPFSFTKSLVTKKLAETQKTPDKKILADESIVGTILNGYETRDPWGKRAHSATIMVLTSLIEKFVAHDVISVLRRTFHTGRILPIAGNSLRYQATRTVFPHEQSALILDVSNDSHAALAVIRNNLFVVMLQVPGSPSEEAWGATLAAKLAEVAANYPLPRTIFLLARDADTQKLKEILASATIGKLWLTDSPPKIITIIASQLSESVRQAAPDSADLPLSLMAIYYTVRAQNSLR